MQQVAQQHPTAFVRNFRGLGVLQGLLAPVDRGWRGPRDVIWLEGETGAGKSRAAFDLDRDLHEPLRAANAQCWWDTYRRGQATVLFDEIRPGQLSYADVLKWTDGRAFTASVKGSTVDVDASTWVFTSNFSPYQVWQGEDMAPFMRRLTRWVVLSTGNPPVVKKGVWPRVITDHGVGPGNTPQVLPAPPAAAAPVSDWDAPLSDEELAAIIAPGSNPPGWPVHWVVDD